jgi:hypothetical protein
MNGMGQPMGQQMEGMEYANNGRVNSIGDGRHALQDYQMQLMLLEQQNKKRLLQARREQGGDIMNPGGNGAPTPGQPFAPNMSPSGSRGAGPSPNPADQMKRNPTATPKLQQLPGSPMPDMPNRGSPAPNFDPSSQLNMQQQYYNMANMGRPPSSHPNFINNQMSPQQIEQMRVNSARMPNGPPWQPGVPGMPPNAGGPQPGGQMGAPQQRPNNMPPPPAPADQAQGQQRAQPSPPTQTTAPPTPSQAPKSAPKGKKEAAAKKV